MSVRALVALVLLAGVPAAAGEPRTISGLARIVDGDTLVIGAVRVRLKGISAPEIFESVGPQARDRLVAIVAGRPVSCTLTGEHTQGREVGFCAVGRSDHQGGNDLGRVMVLEGFALACPRFSPAYIGLEPASGHVQRAGYRLPGYCLPR